MYKIGTLNKISPRGLANFSDKYSVSDNLSGAAGIIVRSSDMREMEFEKNLMCIARAGAGVNNIPLERCADMGIVVFNTPGANANAVKELVVCGLILAARNVPAGIGWAKTLTENVSKTVEKGKSRFAGTEIKGKILGVIGVGAVGILVANAAAGMGMRVYGYDPFLGVPSAHKLSPAVRIKWDIKEILPLCDYVSIHVPSTDTTRGMFNKKLFGLMKEGAVLLNFARGNLVNDADVLEALENKKLRKYVTDFPNGAILGKEGVISIPHLGASTEEAEENCASMAVFETMDYMENGNIVNSVNFPDISLAPVNGENRVVVMTKDEPYPVKLASAMFGDLHITSVTGGVKGRYGCALLSTPDEVSSVPKADKVIRVRIVRPDEE